MSEHEAPAIEAWYGANNLCGGQGWQLRNLRRIKDTLLHACIARLRELDEADGIRPLDESMLVNTHSTALIREAVAIAKGESNV